MSEYGDRRIRLFNSLAVALVITAVALRPSAYGQASEFWFNLLIHLPVALAAMFWLLDAILARRLTISRCSIGIPALVYAAAVAFSPLFAVYEYPAAQTAIVWLSNIVLFFLAINLGRNKKVAAVFLAALIASMAGAAAHGGWQKFGGFEIKRREAQEMGFFEKFPSSIERTLAKERLDGDEPYATFTTSNLFATFLLTALPAALLWLAASIRRKRTAAILCLLPLTACAAAALWLSGSVAGIAVFGLQALIMGALYIRSRFRASWKYPAIVLALATLGAGVIAAPMVTASKSVQFRFGYWESSLGVFCEYPWTGTGLENFRWAYTRHKIPEAGEVAAPHNSVIQSFTEMGIIGGVSFLAIWVFFLAGGKARKKSNPAHPTKACPPEAGCPAALVVTGFAAAVLMYAVITANYSMEGLRSAEGHGSLAAALKAGVWLVVFLVLALSINGKKGADEGLLRLLGTGATIGAIGFFLHSLFDVGINSFAANQAMWLALACAIALRSRQDAPPLLDFRLKPTAQLLLAIPMICVVAGYVAMPLRGALREKALAARAETMLNDRRASRRDVRNLGKTVLSASGCVETLESTAMLLSRFGEYKAAAELFERAITLNKNDSSLYESAANLALQIKGDRNERLREALVMIERAVERYPNSPSLRVRRAYLVDEIGGDREKIIADLRHARNLLAKNRDENGAALHLSLELEPESLQGRGESDRQRFERLCERYGIVE